MSVQRPRVSVVIPLYNVGDFVAETISSVLNQTYGDFEIIAIIDGSTDDTAEQVSRFRDERLLVYTIPNQGVSHARNLGISLSRGQYIAFLDGDDIWSPTHLQSAMEYLSAHAEVAWWSSRCFSSRLSTIASSSPVEVKERLQHYYGRAGIFVNSSTVVLKASSAKAMLPLFPEGVYHGEDWCAWMSYAEKHPMIAYLPKKDVMYRIREGSATSPTCGGGMVTKFMAVSHHMAELSKRDANGQANARRLSFFRFRTLERWQMLFLHLNPSGATRELRNQKDLLGCPLYILLRLMVAMFVCVCWCISTLLREINRIQSYAIVYRRKE